MCPSLDEIPDGRIRKNGTTPVHFWPIYGERDEICLRRSPSRVGGHVRDMLGLSPPDNAVLLSDGYAAYASYAK